MRTVTRISQLTVAAALGLSLAACGSSSSSGSNTSAGKATSGAASSASGSATGGSSAPTSAATSEQSSATGGSDQAGVPDAKTLVHEARAAYNSAQNAKLHADMADGTKKEVVDIQGDVDGANQDLTIATEDEGTATVRTVDPKNYIKGNKIFWTKGSGAPEATAALLADKWVSAPASTAKSLTSLNIKGILDSVMGPAAVTDSKLATAKTSKSTMDGKDIYVITTSKGNTIKISADKKYVLELNSTKGKMTVTGWNEQPKTQAPANPITVPSSVNK